MIERKPTQEQRVLAWAKEHNGISTLEAMFQLGIVDLQGRIRDIKKNPKYEVTDAWEKSLTGARYKRYFIKEISDGAVNI